MRAAKLNKQANQKALFEAAVRSGLDEAGRLIVSTSSRCLKKLKGSPIEPLAVNVHTTLKVFVQQEGDGVLMRFGPMAEHIVRIVVEERPKTFCSTDNAKKIAKMGKSFGFMAGMAVLTSVIKLFLNQASVKLQEKEELSPEAKRTCLSYINDVFGVILMTLSSVLDGQYRTTKRERIFFSDVLANNDWSTLFKRDDDVGEVGTEAIVSAEEASSQSLVES